MINLLTNLEETLLEGETWIHRHSDLRLNRATTFALLLNGDLIPHL